MNFDGFDEFSRSFGLIKCSAWIAAKSFQNWQQKVLSKVGFSIFMDERRDSLRDLMDDLYPLTGPISTKYLLYQINDDWTLYLDNGYGGVDAGPPVILSSRLGVDSIRAVMDPGMMAMPSRELVSYPATIFEYYENGVERRHIFSAFDGAKWAFGQSGEAFCFEECSHYKSRTLRSRFTPELLCKYLRELGVGSGLKRIQHDNVAIGYFLRKEGVDVSSLPVSVERSKTMNISLVNSN